MLWTFLELTFVAILLTILLPVRLITKKIIFLFSNIIITIIITTLLLLNFNFSFYISFFNSYNFSIIFSLDNLTILFCFLTVFLISISFLITWDSPKYNNNFFLLILWLLEFSLFHTFTSLNLISFFIFFEMSLIPMFLLILIWGSRQRKIHAVYLFFFFTATGSILLLIALFLLYYHTQTFYLPTLFYIKLPITLQKILWLLFFFGFAVKVPIIPFHTWLPEAHVEAPTSGSIILAGLLLKVGTFGMLRFMFPLLNEASLYFKHVAYFFAIFSIFYASFIALSQIDMKKIIAYSSIAHMGFVILGIFSFNIYGYLGSLIIMFSHGIVSSALFFIIGCSYDRYKTKNIYDYGGLVTTMPLFSSIFFILTITNMSFPGTSNFIGESLVLLGISEINYFLCFFTSLSIILTSVYSIWLFNRVNFGKINCNLKGFKDLTKIEFYVSTILIFFIFFFGLFPNFLLQNINSLIFDYLQFI